jgi:4-hydroxy-tetrahydrodipicolinate reductase
MGRAVVQLVAEAPDLELAAAFDAEGSSALGRDAGELAHVGPLGVALRSDLGAMSAADVVIDFSLPVAIAALVQACIDHGRPLVLATTGLSAEHWRLVDELARHCPVVAAPNYSTGVTVLYHLAQKASALLAEFDLEIVEMHHRNKVDAPSGTALGLAEAAAKGRELVAKDVSVWARQGHTGPRTRDEIGVMTLRGGDVVGDHTLILAGPSERLELTHRAHDRALFARGALRAARWLQGRAPGKYGMTDVLGLS